MTTVRSSGSGTDDQQVHRRFIVVAALAAFLATLHFIDHAVRGQLVVDRGLDPAWNHSGWPFQPRFTPFTVSLVLVYGLLLGGIAFSLRGRAWAGYWLAAAIILGAVVTQVHFVPGPSTETPGVIIATYGNRAIGIPAVIVTFGIVVTLIIMGVQAIRVRRISRRW